MGEVFAVIWLTAIRNVKSVFRLKSIDFNSLW